MQEEFVLKTVFVLNVKRFKIQAKNNVIAIIK